MVNELTIVPKPGAKVSQVRHSDKSPKKMAKKEEPVPTNKANKPVAPAKPELRKPVIVFYKNNQKSGWQMYSQVCFNKDQAKAKIKVMTGSEIIKCIDVPEDLLN